jgi:hypothetical protein
MRKPVDFEGYYGCVARALRYKFHGDGITKNYVAPKFTV